jgi:hypothetical protein
VTPAQALQLAQWAGVAVPALLAFLDRIGCVVCETQLDTGPVPDVRREALDAQAALARRTIEDAADEVLRRGR